MRRDTPYKVSVDPSNLAIFRTSRNRMCLQTQILMATTSSNSVFAVSPPKTASPELLHDLSQKGEVCENGISKPFRENV